MTSTTSTHPILVRTIRGVLQEGSMQVGRFEAAVLLAHVIGKRREYLIAHDDEELSDASVLRFQMLVSLRLAGTPVPYLTGRQEFFGRNFFVDDAVLIPRPDTEVLVEQALVVAHADLCFDFRVRKLLQLGAVEGVQGDLRAPDRLHDGFLEGLADGHHLVARKNAEALDAAVEFRSGSWWEAVGDETFDLIVSNPPYIREDDEHLKALGCEPITALTAPENGLADLRAIVAGAMAHLKPNGWLLLEHGYDQGEAVSGLLEDAGFTNVRVVKDLPGKDRVVCGCWEQ